MNDLTCLRLDCCHVSRMSHFGVVLLFRLPKFHSRMMLLCLRVLSYHHQSARVLDVDGFYGSLVILFVTCLGEQFLSLRMMPSWVTRVRTLVETGREFAGCRLRAMRVSAGVSGCLTHMIFFSKCAVRGVYDPLLEIPSRPRIRLTGTFRTLSVVSVNYCESTSRALT